MTNRKCKGIQCLLAMVGLAITVFCLWGLTHHIRSLHVSFWFICVVSGKSQISVRAKISPVFGFFFLRRPGGNQSSSERSFPLCTASRHMLSHNSFSSHSSDSKTSSTSSSDSHLVLLQGLCCQNTSPHHNHQGWILRSSCVAISLCFSGSAGVTTDPLDLFWRLFVFRASLEARPCAIGEEIVIAPQLYPLFFCPKFLTKYIFSNTILFGSMRTVNCAFFLIFPGFFSGMAKILESQIQISQNKEFGS